MTQAPPKTLLIDADVHEQPPQGFKRPLDLLPYLDPHWARYLSGEGGVWTGMPLGASYIAPIARHGVREDWGGNDRPGGGTSLDVMVEELIDGEGVTTPILNGQLWYPSVMPGDPEFAAALAAAYNDFQIEHWLDADSRFCGSVHVAAQQPEVAAREIDRVAKHPQIVQVILPMTTKWQWGDPVYRPIWEAAVRNDLAVAFHHGGSATGTALGYPRYWIEYHTMAGPQASMSQVMSLIVNGTFDRYPDLKVVCLEAGVTWVSFLIWRLDQQFRELRTGTPWVKRLPSEHIRSNVRVATQPITEVTPGEFEALVEMTQTQDVFVFASDYPHYDADSSDVLDALSDDLRQRIRYKNALGTWPRLEGLVL